jgi:peroxiredoxin Q/BCP
MPQKKSKKKPAKSAVKRTRTAAKTSPPAKAAKATAKPNSESKAAARPTGLAEGVIAPDFRLPRDGGAAVSQRHLARANHLVNF